VTVVTKSIFFRRQPNRKLRYRQLIPLTVEEHIGKHNYRLKLPWKARLHPVFHVNNLSPSSATSLRYVVIPVTMPENENEEFDVCHIRDVCIKQVHGRRGKYLLFMAHFHDDNIPHVWHRLNDAHRTKLLS
jgi:hypothetical protein